MGERGEEGVKTERKVGDMREVEPDGKEATGTGERG